MKSLKILYKNQNPVNILKKTNLLKEILNS